MRGNFSAAVIALCLSACTMITPKNARALAEAPSSAVDEFRYVVQLPTKTVYRNMLEKARECWEQKAVLSPAVWHVEADPFDADEGFARISVRVSDYLIATTVTLRPLSNASTEILARSVKVSGGLHHLSQRDLPYLNAWAMQQTVPCMDK